METMKLEEVHTIETQNCTSPSDVSSSAKDPPADSPIKRKRKKKQVMPLDSKKKLVSEKPKILKSKGEQAGSDNSKKPGSVSRKRTRNSDVYEGNLEAKFSVMERADKALARLENGLPFFTKCMLPSNVSHGFWLHLPAKFCALHLPNHDTSITLEDEWGNEYQTSYLIERHGLSAGWRGFSIVHRLLKGDVLIFHLIGLCKLKVHIVRVNCPEVVEAAVCLMSFVSSLRKKRKKPNYVEPFLLDDIAPLDTARRSNAHQSESNSDGSRSEVTPGSEVTNQLQPDKVCYSESEMSFLHGHAGRGVTCW